MDERIIKTEYSEVMQKSYIDYAMSVIIARALPDVRDGLKPVQRRTLYDMYELGIRYDRPYRKSARIVGDTMGKYHPHGDSSIYEALVVMTQEFKKGLPLIDGHGNFGNIEGDGAAAMRYTEARLQRITQEAFLADLDKNVVDFIPNFDETEREPSVLPVRIPNLLINGAEGIAVGMATSIPPHNLEEVINAVKAYIQNPAIDTGGLMKYIKGPDFPTGGIIINKSELCGIYETGTGKVKVRGRIETEKGKSGRINLIITEIPYPMIGSGISRFLSDVAALAETKKTADIVDISNQSSKEGIRIVIELRKDADVENFKNMLYKKTRLEDTFGVNMLAISQGRPETMGLKEIIKASADFQFELTERKYTTLLAREQEKKEIQEGLIKACNVIDLIIEILRGSRDRAMAKNCLVEGVTEGIRFKSRESQVMAQMLRFTERQANAILEMRLYKLIGLELDALVKEHEETLANIYRYEDILERRDSMATVILHELEEVKKAYRRKRRTVVEDGAEAVFAEKKPEEMDVVFLLDRFGYVFSCKNTGRICLFTDTGALHTIKVMDVPFGKFRDKGVPLDNISNYDSSAEQIVYAADQRELHLRRVLFVTKLAMVKIVDGGEFDVAKRMVAATKLQEGDAVVDVTPLGEQRDIVLQTEGGYFLKFSLEEIPEKKKNALGVRGMKLGEDDMVKAVYYTGAGTADTIPFQNRTLDLQKVKSGKRDTKGTKVRGV